MDAQQQTQQQPIVTTPLASPMHNYGSSIIHLTNPESELYKMELTLRSKTLDRDGNEIQAGDPLLNDAGIVAVIGCVQTVVNQVTVMSNLSKQEIPAIMDFLGDTLAKDLMMNRLRYEIKTQTARDRIFFSALAAAFICLKRACEGDDKRFWKGSVQEIHSKVEGAQGKGLMSKLWGLRK